MRNRPLVVLLTLLLLGLFSLVYPVYVIRPFRHQGARELSAALLLTQYRPAVGVVIVVLAVLTLLMGWRHSRGLRKGALVGITCLILACTFLFRINIYEKMFYPLEQPSFSAAAQSKLSPDEQVIAVRINQSARAYPIRDISYHHIVNDTLDGRAIVATY